MNDILGEFKASWTTSSEEVSLVRWLEMARDDSTLYASPSERLLKAIGAPKKVDTRQDPVLGRIFSNRVINVYPAFKGFFGLEEAIERVVGFLRHAAQGLEESKSILYLLGPVGGGKSSIAERLKELMEQEPIWVLKAPRPDSGKRPEIEEISPVFESPLGLFAQGDFPEKIEQTYGIPRRALRTFVSPWAIKRLEEFGGDLSKFTVVKMYPSRLRQVAIAKVEPGDENNQDISSLVGKVDIRKLEDFPQHHPDAYSYSGGLCRTNQGILDFVEMFKAPIKMLHPLLTATQEKNYNGTEAISGIPFDGIILAHSNESEWQAFKNNKSNEAFIDRICLIQVPYCLRLSEEIHIYEKLLTNSSLAGAPRASWTLDLLAQFCVMSRLADPKNSTLYSKMLVYDGENLKDVDPKVKPLQEYRDEAGVTEGMAGVSTRFAFKALAKTFNYDPTEIGADPIHLMLVLEEQIMKEQFPKEREERYLNFLKSTLRDKYLEFVEKQIRTAILDSYGGVCQNVFERYVGYATAWLDDTDWRDPDTGVNYDPEALNKELTGIEKAGLNIVNPKDFRNEVVKFVLRHRAERASMPKWDAFSKMRDVIERKVLNSTEDLLPVISFAPKMSDDERKRHDAFVDKMGEMGYTPAMTRRVTEWFMRSRKNA